MDDGHADADPGVQPHVVDEERLPQGVDEPPSDSGRVLAVLDEHGELVAAEPGQRVRGPQHRPEPLGDLHQQVIAGRVPEGVVDTLEVVQVAEQHREAALVDRVQVERVLDPIGEQPTVGQAGELIVKGLLLQLFFRVPPPAPRAACSPRPWRTAAIAGGRPRRR